MAGLSAATRQFIARYELRRPRYVEDVEKIRVFLEKVLGDLPVAIHGVTGRAKTVESLRGKLRRKKYARPASQLTDIVAVRIITYFARDIDAVEAELRATLDVNKSKSRDVRAELDENEFGYRSVHLISRLRPGTTTWSSLSTAGKKWFEIQIRSILDHAWSEIEHETIYKSGTDYPRSVRRKFMAVAGSLEVIDDAFANLKSERDTLIDQYRKEYQVGSHLTQPFDSARLFAYLEHARPEGVSWRAAERNQKPFAPHLATAALDALRTAGLARPSSLGQVMNTKRFRRAVTDFAALERVAPEAVSHLAVVVVAVACVRPALIRLQFPEILFSPAVAQAVALIE